jgi:hypothetical protein
LLGRPEEKRTLRRTAGIKENNTSVYLEVSELVVWSERAADGTALYH